VIWAREAEAKHGGLSMLASLGAITQDVYTFPFMSRSEEPTLLLSYREEPTG
jgi:hypothetical protein